MAKSEKEETEKDKKASQEDKAGPAKESKEPKAEKADEKEKKVSPKTQTPTQKKEEPEKEAESKKASEDSPKKAPEPPSPPKRKYEGSEGRVSTGPGTNSRFRQRRRVLDTRKISIDYKKSAILERFISKTGKILPRRVTGATALVQRKIAREVKRARHIGLLPYSDR